VRTHRAVRRLLPVALTVVVGTACASAARNPFEGADSPGAQIQVYIENRGFNDLRVYARSSHGQEYVGQVGGNSHLTATLTWRQLDQISFRLEVVAGRTYTTEALPVQPGQRVELIVPDNPANAILRRG